jgi:hypothetical protein
MPDEATSVTSFDQLQQALLARQNALGMSCGSLEALAHLLGGGYPAHVFRRSKQTSSRTLGKMSLGCVLGALGLKIVLVEDRDDALAKVRGRLIASDKAQLRRKNTWPSRIKPPRENAFTVLGRAGGQARAARLSRKQRVKISLKAIRARWSKARAG